MFPLTLDQVNIFHIFVVAGLFIYLGLNGTNSNKFVLDALPWIAIAGVFYHAWRLFQRWSSQGLSLNYWVLVNLFHLFVVFPFLYNLGKNGGRMTAQVQQALPFIGAGIILYHGYRYFQRNQAKTTQA